jgi:hypothetical protein
MSEPGGVLLGRAELEHAFTLVIGSLDEVWWPTCS